MRNWQKPLRVRKLSGVISTDDILPARYKHSYTDPADLAGHVFENISRSFAATLGPNQAIVGNDIFGIGSSREQAVSALLAAGIVAIVAPAFGRIFFRNAWNLGLIALEVNSFPIEDGQLIQLSLEEGFIQSPSGLAYFAPIPTELIEMANEGGLLARIAREFCS